MRVLFVVVYYCFCVLKYKVIDFYNDEFVKMIFYKENIYFLVYIKYFVVNLKVFFLYLGRKLFN